MVHNAAIFNDPTEIISKRRLSERERRFINEYLIDLDPKNASLRAGFGPNTGEKLLQDVFIRTAVENSLEMRASRMEMQTDWVLHELKKTYEAAVCAAKTGLNPRLKALELLMRHLGMLNDKLIVKQDDDIRSLSDAELLRIASRARNVTEESGEGKSDRLHLLHVSGISNSGASPPDSIEIGSCSAGGDKTIDVDITAPPR